ncbi:hypothetical protein [Brucella pseudogrignonensis]|uniref:hypothetical protein n=1 Tax=Brucella pseudogrignonensis TaxID=419475 RepID=UPI003ECF3B09
MKQTDRMRYFWTIAIPASVVGVMFVMMAGSKCALPDASSLEGRCGNPYSNLIYDFQGLIAGLLALGAAVMTVWQMQTNAREEAKLSQAAMALSIREDFLKVERLHTVLMPALRDRGVEWETYRHIALNQQADFITFLVRQHEQLPNYWHSLKRTLSNSHFMEAKPLFNGRTSAIFQSLGARVARLERPCDVLTDFLLGAIDNDEMDQFFADIDFLMAWDDWRDDIISMHFDVRQLIDELAHLEKKYRLIGQNSELLSSLSVG